MTFRAARLSVLFALLLAGCTGSDGPYVLPDVRESESYAWDHVHVALMTSHPTVAAVFVDGADCTDYRCPAVFSVEVHPETRRHAPSTHSGSTWWVDDSPAVLPESPSPSQIIDFIAAIRPEVSGRPELEERIDRALAAWETPDPGVHFWASTDADCDDDGAGSDVSGGCIFALAHVAGFLRSYVRAIDPATRAERNGATLDGFAATELRRATRDEPGGAPLLDLRPTIDLACESEGSELVCDASASVDPARPDRVLDTLWILTSEDPDADPDEAQLAGEIIRVPLPTGSQTVPVEVLVSSEITGLRSRIAGWLTADGFSRTRPTVPGPAPSCGTHTLSEEATGGTSVQVSGCLPGGRALPETLVANSGSCTILSSTEVCRDVPPENVCSGSALDCSVDAERRRYSLSLEAGTSGPALARQVLAAGPPEVEVELEWGIAVGDAGELTCEARENPSNGVTFQACTAWFRWAATSSGIERFELCSGGPCRAASLLPGTILVPDDPDGNVTFVVPSFESASVSFHYNAP